MSKFVLRAGTGYGGKSTSGSHSANITDYGIGSTRVWNNIRIIGTDAQTYYSAGTAFSIGGAIGSVNFYFLGNYVHDCGSDDRGGPIDATNYKAYGIYIGGYGSLNGSYLAWNEFAHNKYGHGIEIYGHTTDDWIDNLYVHDNFVHHNGFRASSIGGGDGNAGWNGTPGGVDYNYVRNAWYYDNIFAYNGHGVPSVGSYEELIICGFGWGANHGNYYVFNNTFYHDYATNLVTLYWSSNPPNLALFQNNIFINTVVQSNAYIIAKGYSDPTSYITGSGYNLYFGSGAGPSWDTHRLDNADPQFVSATPVSYLDFQSQSASPVINAGTSSVSATVTSDFLGVLRPQGAVYDLGAFEFCPLGTCGVPPVAAAPSRPTGLRIQ